MPISRSAFDKLRAKHGTYSSWAVWARRDSSERVKAHIDDLSVLDPDVDPGVLDVLRPDVVFLGLNASSRGKEIEPEPWRNFHDSSRYARDYRIRDALVGTEYWGAFLTDVIERFPETSSGLVLRHLRSHPEEVAEHGRRLAEKLDDLGTDDPLLVAFGRATHRLAQQALGPDRRVIYVTHYSHQVSPEVYRQSVLEAIRTAAG